MKILITGANGQDSPYLALELLNRNYEVYISTRNLDSEFFGLKYLKIIDKVKLVQLDLNNYDGVFRFIDSKKFDAIFHLASDSSVYKSHLNPIETFNHNIIPLINILESVRQIKPSCRIFAASSSEIFGIPNSNPISITHTKNPISPYGFSKKLNHECIKFYRDKYNLFAVSGILFNHESFLRSQNYFVKKIIQQAVRCYLGKADEIEVGNLEIERDFGSAKEYVNAMILMTFSKSPKDYIISSGNPTRLKHILDFILDYLNLDHEIVRVNPIHIRGKEILKSYGNNNEISIDLHWNPSKDFFKIVREIVIEELNFQKNLDIYN